MICARCRCFNRGPSVLPSVSIGIPTRNRCAEVQRAVASVLGQTYTGTIACAVYVDGSTDGTWETLQQMQRSLSLPANRHLWPITTAKRRGIAGAKNLALSAGHAELRGVLDDDDYYQPTFVARCVAALMADPDLDVVYTDNLVADAAGNYQRTDPAGEWDDGDALLRCQLRGVTWLARWDALKRTQLHDERFELEVDYSLFYELWAQGSRFLRIPEALVTCTEHAGRTTNDRTKAAYWHAAGLAKYGHSVTWATRRAVNHPEWLPAIEAGYAHGETLR